SPPLAISRCSPSVCRPPSPADVLLSTSPCTSRGHRPSCTTGLLASRLSTASDKGKAVKDVLTLVLAGGKGTRLEPLTPDRPTPPPSPSAAFPHPLPSPSPTAPTAACAASTF